MHLHHHRDVIVTVPGLGTKFHFPIQRAYALLVKNTGGLYTMQRAIKLMPSALFSLVSH